MTSPFIYGIAADKDHFTDREIETHRLVSNFTHGVNTMIISPRRWGKTSLVNHVADILNAEPDICIVRMDAFSCRNCEDFYRLFATEIIKQTSRKVEEWLNNAKRFLSSLVPTITATTDPVNPFSLTLEPAKREYGMEVLDLPEKIALEKNIRVVVCIDEFQQIGEFSDSLTFQKRLRSSWQHQHNTSYCLYGSKRHLLSEMFGKSSYPFYKFGDILFLGRIPLNYWQDYICQRFSATGREISLEQVVDIYNYVDGNSSYMQQLSWIVWMNTKEQVTQEIIELSKGELLKQNNPFFQEQIMSLSGYQLRYMKALLAGYGGELNHKEVLGRFGLGGTSNVAAVKKALMKKEMVELDDKCMRISDPLLVHWMKMYIE